MSDVLSGLIELGVGVACLVFAWSAYKRPGSRLVTIIFVLAGGSAAGHAVYQLATG